MIDADVRRVLGTAVIAHLATLLPDGAPHAVPVWIAAEGERIAIITGPRLPQDPKHAARSPGRAVADPGRQPVPTDLHPGPGRPVDRGRRGLGDRRPDRRALHRRPLLPRREAVVALIEPEWQKVGM